MATTSFLSGVLHLRFARQAKAWRLFAGAALLAFLTPALSAQSAPASPLVINLATFAVAVAENGKETLTPVAEAKPGQVLVYQATYRNSGATPLNNVAASVPVPAEFAYIEGSARPAALEASIDGQAFFPVAQPPKNTTSAAWRVLRWSPRSLAPGAVFTTEIRVRVAPAATP